VNLERDSGQEPVGRFDQNPAGGRVDDRHLHTPPQASRLNAMLPNRPSSCRLASFGCVKYQSGFQRPVLQSKR
jgi:hypothetical protein